MELLIVAAVDWPRVIALVALFMGGVTVGLFLASLARAAGKPLPTPEIDWVSYTCCYRPIGQPHADYCQST